MEVHAHTHTERKKWTHYFWEFFMLFLAVTAGFFMENLREHYVERQRAHEFAESLIADLKKDTLMLISDIKQIDFVAPRIDTFRTLAQTKNINDYPGGTWYYYARFTSWYFSFNSNNATIEQLKSSGSLRYFKNKEVINAIAQYDRICRSIKELYNYEQPVINKTIELRNKLFNAANFDAIMNFNTPREKIDSFMQKEKKFLDDNKAMLIEMANYCQINVVDYGSRKSFYLKALKLASDLLNLLQKEYHLN